MKPLQVGYAGHAAAQERRQLYYELRRADLSMIDAAAAAGVFERSTRAKYEHWFQAIERGETPVPGRRGRPRNPEALGG